ncbi:hypothetical protein [Nitrosopumilus sp.]|uniref:hypothetical protein n=1 Tax=Nitrosopumilus sp. TaxID=2024843 RepID=UPI003B598AC9
MTCRQVCQKYKAKRPNLPETRYGNGQKRCNRCGIFMEWLGNQCPCCDGKLRTKPKYTGARNRLMVVQKIKRY